MNVQLGEKIPFTEPTKQIPQTPPPKGLPEGIKVEEVIPQNIKKPSNWHEKAIYQLNKIDAKLDEKLPNFAIQNKIDHLAHLIEQKFAPLKQFNDWLDSNGEGKWYKKLAIFLAKLPARAVRNILRLIYEIIKNIIYTIVHPLKSLNNIAKLLIHLVHELTKPETWSKIGVGMIGASLGQALITGNPVSVIGLGIGIALLGAGLTGGAIRDAIKAEKGQRVKAAKHNFVSQVKQLPEAALTGFCMGLIFGGIQRALQEQHIANFRVANLEEAKQFADKFIRENNYPQYSEVRVDPSGKVVLKWWGQELDYLTKTHKEFFPLHENLYYEQIRYAKIELLPDSADLIVDFYGYNGFEGQHIIKHTPLDVVGGTYPQPAAHINLSEYGAMGGVASTFDSTFNKKAVELP